MRLIDADALSKAMYEEAFENDDSYNETNPMARWDSGLWIRYKMFENTIDKAPTIEPKQEWIPCSERLPSEYSDDKTVLVTTDVDFDGLGVIIMPTCDVNSWYRKGYISAWMPLPKPWEGTDDE